MFKEDFFTRVALSYQRLLSSCGEAAPGLRDYCRSHHVAYRDFLDWASTHDLASGLLEADRVKRRLKKVSDKGDIGEQPLLYPLHIITDTRTHRVFPVVEVSGGFCSVDPVVGQQTLVQGVRITFPNGVTMSVRKADVRNLHYLIHGIES